MSHSEPFALLEGKLREESGFKHETLRFAQGDRIRYFTLATCFVLTVFFSFPQPASAQNAGLLQYQFQPNQTLRYRLYLQHEVKMSEGVGQDLPVVTKITFQASARMVGVDSVGVATLEARADGFSVRTTIGSKEVVSPASAVGQTVQFRVGSGGLLPGQEALNDSSGLPWNLFLSQAFPDLTRCRYLGLAIFNGQSCAKIGFDLIAPSSARLEKNSAVQTKGYNQGKGTGLFAEGHLLSGETQGSVDLGYYAKGTFSSRLSLLP